MRRIDLKQVTKAATVYAAVSAATINTWLYVADNGGLINVPGHWYLQAPLIAWGIVGIPASISSAERLFATIYKKPGQIEARAIAHDAGERAIPYTAGGKRGTVFANTYRAIGGKSAPDNRRYSVAWRVTYGEEIVTISEAEVSHFLKKASLRTKHQFSRRYWTMKRRPPIPRPRYEALMLLLRGAGLVEGRQHGASGYLVGNLKPHNAVTFLKRESPYRL